MLRKLLEVYPFILTEGSVVERMKRAYGDVEDPYIAFAGCLYDPEQRKILEGIYKEYIEVAIESDLPIIITTTTRSVDIERSQSSVFRDKNIIEDHGKFLQDIRSQYPEHEHLIVIGGLIGCKGDAYNPKEALSEEEAYVYHLWTTRHFQRTNVDFLLACIMPAVTEIKGMVRAIEETGKDYLVSFMLGDDGKLLDGSFIHDAIEEIDACTKYSPLAYMTNCIHPSRLKRTLEYDANQTELVRERFIGIQANASALSPDELNESKVLRSDSPKELAAYIQTLHDYFPLKIYGGCCGTDTRHIREIGKILGGKY